MIIERARNWNGGLLVVDTRLKYDFLRAQEDGFSGVYSSWGFGKAAAGPEYNRLHRVSLFEYGTSFEVDKELPFKDRKRLTAEHTKTRADARAALRALIADLKPKLTFVLAPVSLHSRDKDEESKKGKATSLAFEAFDPIAPFSELAGTLWESDFGRVMPILNPLNVDFVHKRRVKDQFERGLEFVQGKRQSLFAGREFHYMPGERMVAALKRLTESRLPIAIDIESYSPTNLITAIGVSDGVTTVSVPWDGFEPHMANYWEPGRTAELEALTKRVLASPNLKYLHNGIDYDLPFLAGRGCPVGGPVLDTMLLHSRYRQYRHALQQVAAQLFLLEPWKSEHLKGRDADDANTWIQNPIELRQYNCKDTLVTALLGEPLRAEMGVKV